MSRETMLALFREAVRSVSAPACMPEAYSSASPGGRTVVLALGKAGAAMAAEAARRLSGPVTGLIVTRRGHALPSAPAGFETIEAGHPVPDSESIVAAQRAMALVTGLGPKDRLLALVSGGGSALMAMPVAGVTLADKQALTGALLRSGATIAEINCVRKHLSRIKGGRLAVAAAPAQVTTLLISDVPGDDPSFVASGPTVADRTTLVDARAIVERYRVECSASVRSALADPANETPPGDAPGLAGSDVRIVARARDALAAAARLAGDLGYAVSDLGDHLQAEARDLGAGHAALARRLAGEGRRCAVLSGGETTVTVTNRAGRGGRNLEYLLGFAIALDGLPGVSAIACDTDGIDGTEDNAGAVVTPDTLVRGAALGLDPRKALADNDAYRFFAALGDLVVTGPTLTNVNDFRAILIDPSPD